MQLIKCYLSLLLFALFLSACRFSGERPYSIYETAAEARLAGSIDRGWLPDWLPQSAYQIHEYHDLDTNARAFSFRLSQTEPFHFPVYCRKVEEPLSPRLETKLFVKQIHKLPDVKLCGQIFLVVDRQGIIHGWANSYRP